MLSGADTEKVRKFGHQSLSTYNIGGEHTRAEWGSIGRELVRQGLLFQNAEKFNIAELTDPGFAALKSRQKITLTRPVAPTEPAKHRIGEIACDEMLFGKLRGLRKQLADERGVPPYIVFSDVSLRQMARFYPATDREFSRISGVGDRKLREFGALFLGEIAAHLQSNPRQMFADDFLAERRRADAAPFAAHGHGARDAAFFPAGQNGFGNRAHSRGEGRDDLQSSEEAMLAGEAIDVKSLLTAEAQRDIAAAFAKHGFGSLGSVVASLGGRYDYGQCRIVRAAMQTK